MIIFKINKLKCYKPQNYIYHDRGVEIEISITQENNLLIREFLEK